MRKLRFIVAAVAVFALAGCHSAFINATISNRTAEPLTLIEVDYPSASFGTQTLPAGQDFHYRFKIVGYGATTVSWTDAAQKEHKKTGPVLREGEEGDLEIVFNPGADPEWTFRPSVH